MKAIYKAITKNDIYKLLVDHNKKLYYNAENGFYNGFASDMVINVKNKNEFKNIILQLKMLGYNEDYTIAFEK